MSNFNYVASFYEGGRWASKVADMLNDAGVRCEATPIRIASDNMERDYMTKHEQDIVFGWSDQCLEVKSSSRDFTFDVQAYPFASLFVDTVSGFDAKAQTPLAYVLISQITSEAVCISPKSLDTWRKVNTYDKKREIMEWFYSAPKSALIPFGSLVQFLLRQQRNIL